VRPSELIETQTLEAATAESSSVDSDNDMTENHSKDATCSGDTATRTQLAYNRLKARVFPDLPEQPSQFETKPVSAQLETPKVQVPAPVPISPSLIATASKAPLVDLFPSAAVMEKLRIVCFSFLSR
jgi:hypothetical protein